MSGRILIVDDDADGLVVLRSALRRRAYEVDVVCSGHDALDWLATEQADIVLAHLRMAGMSGVELCEALRTSHPELLTIVVSDDRTLDSAIAALRAGAYDYIPKPIDVEMLVVALERAIAHVTRGSELRRLRSEVRASHPIASIVGDSGPIRAMVEVVHKVADSDATVLIVGESGTGKELVARAVHDLSSRHELPFAAINCGAVPSGLLESELFGHVKGAFTNAHRSRAGLFVEAQGGTIFLDEIGEMPMDMQVKLLRVLQERRVRPVGGENEVSFDARVVTATNRDLEADVAARRFREDLYYRIDVVRISVPPLRARPGDVLLLAQHFINKIALRTGQPPIGIDSDAARALVDYDWPGNVRELENVIERAIALTGSNEISLGDIPDKLREHRRSDQTTVTGVPCELDTLAEVESRYVHQVLAAVGGNKALAARILGIDRRTMYRRLESEHASSRSDHPAAFLDA